MAPLVSRFTPYSRIVTIAFALAIVTATTGCSSDSDTPCEPGPLSVSLTHSFGQPEGVYAGPATVTAHDPSADPATLSLLFDTGEQLDFSYILGPHELPVAVEAQVEAYADLKMPFWTETSLVLREPGPTGALIAAVWDTSGSLPPGEEMAQLSVSYTEANCAPVDDGCGDRLSLALEVPLGEEEPPVRIMAGTEVVDSLRMGNGSASGRYRTPIGCTDTPPDWVAGFLLP